MLARRLLAWAAVLLAVVAGLAVLETTTSLTRLDEAVGEVLVFHGRGPEITVLKVLTAPGAEDVRYPILVPIAGFLLWFRRYRLAAFVAVPALLIAPLNRLLKDISDRPRPSYDATTVNAGDWSFPSGHSSGAAVLAGVLLVLLLPHAPPRWRTAVATAALLAAAVIGWTRLALGVHYLSDVVAGLALGTAAVLLAVAAFLAPGARASDQRPSGTGAGQPWMVGGRGRRALRSAARNRSLSSRSSNTSAMPARLSPAESSWAISRSRWTSRWL